MRPGRAGWSQRQIADYLGVSQRTVSNDVNADILANGITEDLLREAAANLPASVDVDPVGALKH